VLGAGEGAERGFELGHLGAHDVLAVVEHALDACVDGRLERGVLRFEVDELHGTRSFWYRHGCAWNDRRGRCCTTSSIAPECQSLRRTNSDTNLLAQGEALMTLAGSINASSLNECGPLPYAPFGWHARVASCNEP
jgi:hypothetical protein